MQDPRLHELGSAYMQHELDFDEYRKQRTEYIDRQTGPLPAPPTEPAETEEDNNRLPTPSSSVFRQNQLLWLGAVVATLVLIALAIANY